MHFAIGAVGSLADAPALARPKRPARAQTGSGTERLNLNFGTHLHDLREHFLAGRLLAGKLGGEAALEFREGFANEWVASELGNRWGLRISAMIWGFAR